MRRLLSTLALMLLPMLAVAQVSQPPAAGDGGRRTMGVMGTYKTPQEYGARGDAKRRPAMIRTVNASNVLESYGTYALMGVRIQCTAANNTITLTPGVIPAPLTTTNNTRAVVIPCGTAGAAQILNITSISAPGASQTIVSSGTATTTQDVTSNMYVLPQGYSPGVSSTSAKRTTYGAASYTTMSFTRGSTTLTLPSGTLAAWDITTPGWTGAYKTEVAIPNGSGAACDQYHYANIISFVTGDIVTLDSAPTCSATNQVAMIYWGNTIWRSTDVGKSIEIIDGGGAVGSDTNLVTTIASVVDPFNITTAANFGATRTNTQTELTWGTNDTTAVTNMAQAAYQAGYRHVYWPKDFNTFMATATFGATASNFNTWLNALVACGEGNNYTPRSLKYTKAMQRDCVNPLSTPAPSNDINPRTNLRQSAVKSQTAGSNLVAVFVGDSNMQAQSSSVIASGMSDMLCNAIQKKNNNRNVLCYNYGIGGTKLDNFDPNGPPSSNGAGIPTGSTAAFPTWYTPTSNTWMSFVQAKCPDQVYIKFGLNDQLSFLWSSMVSIHNYLQGATWKAACGTNPDEIWMTDSPFGQSSLTNAFSTTVTESNMMLQRGWALSCEYKLANGGCPGLLDLQRARQYGYYGWHSEELAPQRALYLTAPSISNDASRSTNPIVWPVPVYDYAIKLEGIRVTAVNAAAFWASLTSIDFTTGPGNLTTPISAGTTQTGLAQSYDGGKIRISQNGTNFTVQVFTFDVTNTATVTNTAGGSTITCAAACTNMGFINATVELPGAGSAGGTYTGTITNINAAGTVITVTPTLTTALTAQSKSLRIYHDTGVKDTGYAINCVVVSTFCESGFNVIVSGSNYNIYDGKCFSCPPIYSGRLARFGGYFRPTVTLNGTFATYRLTTDSASLPSSTDGRPDNGTMFNIPISDLEWTGQRDAYTGLLGGAGNAHPPAAGDTWLVQAWLDQQHFQADSDTTTGGTNTPSTGFTLTPVAGQKFTAITPAGTLATGTFNLPTGIPQNERVTLFSTQQVTALTVAAPSGYSLSGSAVTTIAANGTISYILNGTTFYRVQ